MLTMTTTGKRRGELLTAILAAGGEWVNRGKLADDTGKRQLSPNDLRWLEMLERDGLIEARKTPKHSPLGYEWEYRAK